MKAYKIMLMAIFPAVLIGLVLLLQSNVWANEYSGFVGSWRVYSARIYYDVGGGGSTGSFTRPLELFENGKWRFQKSTGTYSIENITESDWTKWGINPYGPTKKITLRNWNSSVASGPVEESGGRIDFVWVIYRAVPPVVKAPGTIWLKFGH